MSITPMSNMPGNSDPSVIKKTISIKYDFVEFYVDNTSKKEDRNQEVTIIGTKEAMSDKNIQKIVKTSAELFTNCTPYQQNLDHLKINGDLSQPEAAEKKAWKEVMDLCKQTKITVLYPIIWPGSWVLAGEKFLKKAP